MLSFYYIDKAIERANFDKDSLPGEAFVDWYKSAAQVHRFSKEFSKKMFEEEDPRINQVFNAHIINNKFIPGVPESSNFLYFYLDPFYLKIILQELGARRSTEKDDREMNEFAGLIKDCLDRKGFCLVEYSKKDGWFDYDETMRKKRAEEEGARRQFDK